MKRNPLIAAIAIVGIMSGCTGNRDGQNIPPSISEPAASESYSEASPINETEQILFDEADVRVQFEQTVEACSDVINGFRINVTESAYPMPTLEEYTRMSAAIGALGYPVDYYDLDMPNHEKVVAFWEDVQAGKDAQTVIYCLYNWGIVADILISRNGEQFCTSAVYDFPQETMEQGPEISFGDPIHKIVDLRMTEKGYLLFLIHNDDPDAWPDNRGYRVLPLGEEKRVLGRKYVWGIGYLSNNMLRDNWDKDNLSVLKMDWVFESLYYKTNGNMPYEDYPESGVGDGRVLIPADVMEKVMLNSLPLTVEQLREYIPYDKAGKTYAYLTYNGGGYSGLPEVVSAVRNADGTLTLTIDAVAIEFGKDKSMTSVLTVMDNPDGSVKYLSNTAVIYESGEGNKTYFIAAQTAYIYAEWIAIIIGKSSQTRIFLQLFSGKRCRSMRIHSLNTRCRFL